MTKLQIANNWDKGEGGLFRDAIGNWTWFLGRRNRESPAGAPPRARFFSFEQGDVGFMVLDTRAYRNASEGTMLGREQLQCVREWLENGREWLENGRGGGRVKLRVLVSSVPFTLNTGKVRCPTSSPTAGLGSKARGRRCWGGEEEGREV
eukprot:637194-Hanusia_phi.AAC.1